ncbi:MAG: hypothetical protein BWZ10_01019 [candidate division BRC1 bacterium ADurb.BinA364]|nr:MAG: hypothetical protein BWZ10_01019 [candidate division BRC1 bacterium ADurb.BinA364]
MPLYPLLLAPIVAAGGGPKAMGAANLVLLGLAALAALALGWRIAGWRAGLIGAAGAGLAPMALFWASYPLSEPLFLLLCLLALHAWISSAVLGADGKRANPRAEAWAAAGAALAFAAYLTRSAGMALFAAGLLWLLARRQWRQAGAAALAFLIPFALWAAALKTLRGSYTYSMQNFHLICANFAVEMGQSFGKTYPSAGRFIAENADAVALAVGRHLWQYARVLATPGMLAFLLPLLLLALCPLAWRAGAALLALWAALNYGFSAAIWSTSEGDRFMLPTMAALALLGGASAEWLLGRRRGWRWLSLGLLFAALGASAPLTMQFWRRAAESRTMPLALSEPEARWLEAAIGEMTPVGTDNPFPFNFYCDRPAAWTQWDNPRFDLDAFLAQYPVGALALSPPAAAALRASPWGGRAKSAGIGPMGLEWFAVEPLPE